MHYTSGALALPSLSRGGGGQLHRVTPDEARAYLTTAQQNMAQLATAAPAAKDGATAAQVLSQTPTGAGDSMLQRVLGQQAA